MEVSQLLLIPFILFALILVTCIFIIIVVNLTTSAEVQLVDQVHDSPRGGPANLIVFL